MGRFLMDLMSAQRQISKMSEAGLIVGHRAPERTQRGRQDFDAIQVFAHVVDNAAQFTSRSLYGWFGFHNRFLAELGCQLRYRVKTLGG